jgi:rhamnulokinase
VTRAVLAIDLGASSGRVVLARWDGTAGTLDEVHRFPNAPVERDGNLFWDIDAIWTQIARGLQAAAARVQGAIDSVGVDGWAVDYALLDAAGERIAPVFCYRDARNAPAMRRALASFPRGRLYGITGIQFLPFNTLYQLLAHRDERLAEWERTRTWLNLPEYFLFRLSGVRTAEYTNVTHTQMIDCRTRTWSSEVLSAFGLERDKFPPIVQPGTDLGPLRAAVVHATGLRGARVIAPACHDTGSTVAGLPFAHDRLAFISSGTWSLVGTVVDAPVVTEAAHAANFTNEGGVGGTIRLLKNVIGLWLLQQCEEEWRAAGRQIDAATLVAAVADAPTEGPFFDADNDRFLSPGQMVARINAALAERGHRPLEDPAAIAAAIFRSLARRYVMVLDELWTITGKRIDAIGVAGGGVKNRVLSRMTRELTGLPVLEAAAESAAIGNAAVQIAALEESWSPDDLQAIVKGFS